MRRLSAWLFKQGKRARRLGAAAGRGALRALAWFGRQIGMLEVSILALAAGAYLVARLWFPAAGATGVALLVAGGLALIVHLIYDVLWLKKEGNQR